jgi:hypothetical protein
MQILAHSPQAQNPNSTHALRLTLAQTVGYCESTRHKTVYRLNRFKTVDKFQC